ncbi:MAG: O-antigen ligase family protein [Actinobacteria bacterium]|nr:O-antigen ligase family protein [Actinomycetota bacterium]
MTKYPFRALFVLLLPLAAILFDRDEFALWTPVGRFIIFDLLTILFIAYTALTTKRLRRISSISVLIGFSVILLGCLGLISTFYLETQAQLPNYGAALVDSARYLMFGVLILLLMSKLDANLFKLYMRVWMAAVLVVVTIGIGQVMAVIGISPFDTWFTWGNIRGGGYRIASTFRWQGPLVMFLGLSLPLLVALTILSRQATRVIVYSIFLTGALIVLLFTGARSVLLVLPLSFLPLSLAIPRRFVRVLAIPLCLLSLSAATVYNGELPRQILRITGSGDLASNMVDEGRLWIWGEGLELWGQSPIFGIGPSQLGEYIGKAPHNSYVEVLIEHGIFALIPLLLLVGSILVMAFKLVTCKGTYGERVLRSAMAAALLNTLLYQISASAITYRVFWLFLPLALWHYELLRVELGQETRIMGTRANQNCTQPDVFGPKPLLTVKVKRY